MSGFTVGQRVRARARGIAGTIEAIADQGRFVSIRDHEGLLFTHVLAADLAPIEPEGGDAPIFAASTLPPIEWFHTSQIAAERVANDPVHARRMSGDMVQRLAATVVYQAGALGAVRANAGDPAKVRKLIDQALPPARRIKGDEQ